MKFQPVINLIGLLLCTLSAFMLIPGFVDYVLGDEDWAAFLVSSFITLFVGAGLYPVSYTHLTLPTILLV